MDFVPTPCTARAAGAAVHVRGWPQGQLTHCTCSVARCMCVPGTACLAYALHVPCMCVQRHTMHVCRHATALLRSTVRALHCVHLPFV